MADKALVDYINEELSRNVPLKVVTTKLREAEFSKKDIDTAFQEALGEKNWLRYKIGYADSWINNSKTVLTLIFILAALGGPFLPQRVGGDLSSNMLSALKLYYAGFRLDLEVWRLGFTRAGLIDILWMYAKGSFLEYIIALTPILAGAIGAKSLYDDSKLGLLTLMPCLVYIGAIGALHFTNIGSIFKFLQFGDLGYTIAFIGVLGLAVLTIGHGASREFTALFLIIGIAGFFYTKSKIALLEVEEISNVKFYVELAGKNVDIESLPNMVQNSLQWNGFYQKLKMAFYSSITIGVVGGYLLIISLIQQKLGLREEDSKP
jgi:hypothetical protein